MRLSRVSLLLSKHLDHPNIARTQFFLSLRSNSTILKSDKSAPVQTAKTPPVNTTIAKSVGQKNVEIPKVVTATNTNDKKTTTVDKKEVDHHTAQIDHWWDPQGKMKALHAMNLVRVPFVRDGLVAETEKTCQPLKGKKILDIGCGGGILSEGLARLGAEVTGIDASKELIELATKHSALDQKIAKNKPKYILTSVEDHVKTHKDYYDGVVASEIIEHISNKELFVQASVGTLKKGGRIFFTTPCRTRLAQVTGIFIAEYVLEILPKGTHQYEKFTTPPELTFLLERNQCHVESIQGLFYHVMTNRWQWVNTKAFVFALQAQKLDITNDKK